MSEETNDSDRMIRIEYKLDRVEKKLDKLIPEVRDVSKYLAEAKQTANKGKPPRKQPKKKDNPHYCYWCKYLSFDKKGDWHCATGHGMIFNGDDTIDFKTQNCPRWEDKAVSKS